MYTQPVVGGSFICIQPVVGGSFICIHNLWLEEVLAQKLKKELKMKRSNKTNIFHKNLTHNK